MHAHVYDRAMTDSTDFFSRSRSAQLRHVRALAHTICDVYALSNVELKLMRYEDNAVYRVKAAGRTSTLRISLQTGRSLEEQLSEVTWLKELHRSGFHHVPQPLATTDGRDAGTIRDSPIEGTVTYVMFAWVPGAVMTRYTQKAAAELGQMAGQLHVTAQDARHVNPFRRPSWQPHEIGTNGYAIAGERSLGFLGEQSVGVLRSAASKAERTIDSTVGRGLIHADLHRENVIQGPDGAMSFIDFDDCGVGPFMLDVATMLSSAYRSMPSRVAYDAFRASFLAAYDCERSSGNELATLDAFLVLRDFVILNFICETRNPTVMSWRGKRAQGIVQSLRGYVETGAYPGGFRIA